MQDMSTISRILDIWIMDIETQMMNVSLGKFTAKEIGMVKAIHFIFV